MGHEPSAITLRLISGKLIDRILQAVEQQKLSELLANDEDCSPLKFLVYALIDNVNPTPIVSILKIVRKRYKCFAIMEEPYIDLEEWSAYAAFYSRSFTSYDRLCKRFHFFDGPEEHAERVLDELKRGILDKDMSDLLIELKLAYRGFSVLRPGTNLIVGRSAIEFDGRLPHELAGVRLHDLEKSGIPYCTARINNKVHLGSLELSVETAPFIQQDPVVGMCATASVWVASQVLSHRFDLHKFPYTTITKQASANYPSPETEHHDWKFGKGLSQSEIQEALSHTGAATLIINPQNQALTRLLLYTYVESGLPVIACYLTPNGGHAVTIVGHLLPEKGEGKDSAESDVERVIPETIIRKDRHHCVGQAVQLYYTHNDNYGPFDRLQIVSDRKARLTKWWANKKQNSLVNEARCLVARGRDGIPENSLIALVVSLPPYVQNEPSSIIWDAMRRFDAIFPREDNRFKILWRFLLAYSPDFKRSVIERNYPKPLQKKYTSMHLPLYVWIAEFTITPVSDDLPLEAERYISGEFIYDSTTPFYDPRCLSQRVHDVHREEGTKFKSYGTGEGINIIGCYVPKKQRS